MSAGPGRSVSQGRWSFPPKTRGALLTALSGYEDPAGLVRALEANASSYDPAGVSNMRLDMMRTYTAQLKRVEREAGRLRKTLEALRGIAGLQLAWDFEDAIKSSPRSRPAPGDSKAVHDFHRSLVLFGAAARTAMESSRPRRGRPPDDLRRNLCRIFGMILGGAPAKRARRVIERMGDVAEWRTKALHLALPLVLEGMGAMPHQRDLPPLLRVAQDAAEERDEDDPRGAPRRLARKARSARLSDAAN